ncbi:hypothetical protein Z043_122591, partial [Scleropages formosus]
YAGYCPQLKYHHGQTYGKLTAQLLSSPEASLSRRLVLQTARAALPDADSEQQQQQEEEETCRSRRGFVPKSQNYFSRSYAETCRRALSEFERERRKRLHVAALAAPSPVENKAAPELKSTRHHAPLTSISREPTAYRSLNQWKPLGSPYLMEDSNPNKNSPPFGHAPRVLFELAEPDLLQLYNCEKMLTGFTGYVPKSRFLIGMGYPVTTNKALIQFNSERRRHISNTQLPGKDEAVLPPLVNIYSSDQGLLPSYTGHVPGYKFRYGQTFGQLTQNSLDVRRQTEDNE